MKPPGTFHWGSGSAFFLCPFSGSQRMTPSVMMRPEPSWPSTELGEVESRANCGIYHRLSWPRLITIGQHWQISWTSSWKNQVLHVSSALLFSPHLHFFYFCPLPATKSSSPWKGLHYFLFGQDLASFLGNSAESVVTTDACRAATGLVFRDTVEWNISDTRCTRKTICRKDPQTELIQSFWLLWTPDLSYQ